MTAGSVADPRILLVDDKPDELRLLVEALKEETYRVDVSCNGARGYARAVAMRPDLILLDVHVPQRDGFTVARMLKANPETQHIPILFLSASTELSDRLTGLRSGAVDYIVKPCHSAEVLERVRIHLQLALTRGAARVPCLTPQSESVAGGFPSAGDVTQHLDSEIGKGSAGIRESVLLRAAKLIVFDRLGNPPSTAELARSLGVSERRISSVFHQETGMSLFEFMRQERMNKASRLLAQTEWPITEIAQEVGYSSAANFSTAFREYYAATPSGYRENLFKKAKPRTTADRAESSVDSDAAEVPSQNF